MHIHVLSQKKTGTHLGIIASAMMGTLRDSEPRTQISEFVAAECIYLSGCSERASPFEGGKMNVVQFSRFMKATAVERHIVGHEGIELIEIKTLYLLPYLIELRSITRVIGSDSVDLNIEVAVAIVLRAHEP